jgi:putative transposase
LKAKRKIGRIHARIANIRNYSRPKLTTALTKRFHTVCIEELNVKAMMRNRHLARSVAEMGFFEFRRQVESKANRRGGLIVVADRWLASSKSCSQCGQKLQSLALSMRRWDCPNCGVQPDRDFNAAMNLKN